MARMSDRFPASAAATATACFGLLLAGLSVAALQGCRQSGEATNPSSERARPDSVRIQPPECWELRLTARGAERDSLRAWLPAGSLPSVVELDTTRASGAERDSVYEAYSWAHGRRTSQPFSVWRRLDDGAIRVQRAGALAGTMLHLRPDVGALSGTVVVFRDAEVMGRPTRREGSLEAVRVQCPAK